MKTFRSRSSAAGFTLLEALISILVIALGLLGLAGLQVRMQQAEFESYQRSQALVLLYDMVDRIQFNRAAATCFAFTDEASGTPFVGTGANAPAGCTASIAENNAMADAALADWDAILDGAAETSGGNSVGAMIGARGCISYNAASELENPPGTPIPGTGVYTVAIAWQGTVDTAAPTRIDGTALNCANDLYGPETQRRTVYTTFRIATLN